MGERGLEVGSLAVGCGRLVGGAVCGQLLAVSGTPLDCEGQLESGAQSGAAQGTGSTHLEGVVLGPPPPRWETCRSGPEERVVRAPGCAR